MTRSHCGFHVAEADANAGTKYLFRLPDGRELPDPASRFQPVGVHGASAVVDAREFRWTDSNFQGHALSDLVIYEFHVGTFTSEGTFEAAIRRLPELAKLGITAVEVMPIAQFPGTRNWGYDGVYPFAAQNSYGGPGGLQQFVDAAHASGMSVILDVVYNHLGPEGNYLGAFGPFFTDRYHTPWGQAINYDDAQCAPVREFFIQNAIYWLEELHIDGLRLDAVHGIFDFSAHHFLAELKERVQALAERTGRTLHVIAESDLNDARLLQSPDRGGYGLDAQWSDDFHHSVHTLLTGESSSYYADFGSLENLHTVLRDGWLYAGQYSPFRQRAHGNSALGISPEHFVVCSQNHDQVGNRAAGDRLSQLVDFESLKLAAGITLLSPFVPLLFMGEEYGETHPFQYFTSHSDAALIEAVRKGRRDEFAAFGWQGDVPDPQDEETFRRSTLDPAVSDTEPHRTLWLLYKTLITIRKKFALGSRRPTTGCDGGSQTLWLEYAGTPGSIAIAFHFANETARIKLPREFGLCKALLNSSTPEISEADQRNAEPSQADFDFGPRSFVIFESIRSGEQQ
jgi:maltooligosyltrehalose trehalohydrolase